MELLYTLLKESFVDVAYNKISLTILLIIVTVSFALFIALFSKKVEVLLRKIKILEEHEKPRTLLLWILGIVIAVKVFQGIVLQPFIVDGGSMLSTFRSGEFLLVDKLTFLFKEPKRGEVIVFKFFEGEQKYLGRYLIKRIIGLPGERVVVKDGKTIIHNKENPKGFVYDESFLDPVYNQNKTYRGADIALGEKEYFMMGDNRDGSYDSRIWGALPKKDMRGRAFLRMFPHFEVLPGDQSGKQ
jgi:signal peptidase I